MPTNRTHEGIHFDPSTDQVFELAETGSWPATKHRFERDSVLAVQTALAAERPLLISGDPGVGKSQLARAAAHVMNVPFLYYVVSARTEHTDLLYSYDAVSRLAQAQVLSHADSATAWQEQLTEDRYLRPGVLWWAFDWAGARQQAKRSCRNDGCAEREGCCEGCGEPDHPPEGEGTKQWRPGRGCVVLVDEIDKADTDMPNGLLESFGNNGFQAPYARQPVVRRSDHAAPLLMITTNQERELPAAFVRRCLVLHMKIPGDNPEERKQFLIRRGKDHCQEWITSGKVYETAVEHLFRDRQAAREAHALVKPGSAEYLDLLYALSRLCPNDEKEQRRRLEELRDFVFCKSAGGTEW